MALQRLVQIRETLDVSPATSSAGRLKRRWQATHHTRAASKRGDRRPPALARERFWDLAVGLGDSAAGLTARSSENLVHDFSCASMLQNSSWS